MKFTIMTAAAAAALLYAGAAVAQSRSDDLHVIVVNGYATASKPADFGRLKFDLRGEGATRLEALGSLADSRKRVEGGLAGLVNVKRIAIEPAPIRFDEVRGANCEDENGQLSKGPCAVTGYIAKISEEVRITPAERTGDAASLVAQLGANSVAIQGGGLDDPRSLQTQAAAKALAEARSEAQAIAAAQGVRLGPVVRVDPGRAVGPSGVFGPEDMLNNLPQAFSNQSPKVRFERTVADVETTATYTVTYAIER